MKASCIQCHNSHPDSPKNDWEVGDVRGVVEIIRPLDQDEARMGAGLHSASVFLGVVCAVLLGLTGLALVVERVRRGRTTPV
jgi:hypothetical protein